MVAKSIIHHYCWSTLLTFIAILWFCKLFYDIVTLKFIAWIRICCFLGMSKHFLWAVKIGTNDEENLRKILACPSIFLEDFEIFLEYSLWGVNKFDGGVDVAMIWLGDLPIADFCCPLFHQVSFWRVFKANESFEGRPWNLGTP